MLPTVTPEPNCKPVLSVMLRKVLAWSTPNAELPIPVATTSWPLSIFVQVNEIALSVLKKTSASFGLLQASREAVPRTPEPSPPLVNDAAKAGMADETHQCASHEASVWKNTNINS